MASSRASVFNPVENAPEVFLLNETGSLLEYPTNETAGRAVAIEPIRRALSGVIERAGAGLLVGPVKCGKTFQAILAGREWHKKSPQHLALYAVANLMDVERVAKQIALPDNRKYVTLWIIDDAHNAVTAVREIVSRFEDQELSKYGHRLLLLAWSRPDQLADIPWKGVGMTAEAINTVLFYKGYAPIPEEQADSLAKSGIVSLAEIMWAASEPSTRYLLSDPNALGPEWLKTRIEQLAPAEQSLFSQLAVLRFFGVGWPRSRTSRELRRLLDTGIATAVGTQCFVGENEARLTFRGRSFDWCCEALEKLIARHHSIVIPLTRALAVRTAADLSKWTDLDSKWGGPLVRYINDDLAAALTSAIARLSPIEAIRPVIALRTSPIGQTLAASFLAKQGQTIAQRLLSTNDPYLWQDAANLAKETNTSIFNDALTAVPAAPEFAQSVVKMPGQDRGQLLRAVYEYDAGRWRQLLPAMFGFIEAWRARPFWSTLESAMNLEPLAAIEVFNRVASQWLADAIWTAPSACRKFIDNVPKAQRGAIFGQLGRRIKEASFEWKPLLWENEYDVAYIIRIARVLNEPRFLDALTPSIVERIENGTPAVVHDVTHALGQWPELPTAIRQSIVTALDSRAKARPEESVFFTYLFVDPARAAQLARQAILDAETNLSVVENASLFRALWHGLLTMNPNDADLVRAATTVAERWKERNGKGDLFTAALAGIVGIVTNRELDLQFEEYSSEIRSPDLTAAHLAGIAFSNDGSPIAVQRAREILQGLANPTLEFKDKWFRRNLGRSRGVIVQILEKAVIRLLQREAFAADARVYCAAIANEEQDTYWSSHPNIRLGLIIRSDGKLDVARRVVARIEPQFEAFLLRTRIPTGVILPILLRVVCLSIGIPRQEQIALHLLAAAIAREKGKKSDVVIAARALQALVKNATPARDGSARDELARALVKIANRDPGLEPHLRRARAEISDAEYKFLLGRVNRVI